MEITNLFSTSLVSSRSFLHYSKKFFDNVSKSSSISSLSFFEKYVEPFQDGPRSFPKKFPELLQEDPWISPRRFQNYSKMFQGLLQKVPSFFYSLLNFTWTNPQNIFIKYPAFLQNYTGLLRKKFKNFPKNPKISSRSSQSFSKKFPAFLQEVSW